MQHKSPKSLEDIKIKHIRPIFFLFLCVTCLHPCLKQSDLEKITPKWLTLILTKTNQEYWVNFFIIQVWSEWVYIGMTMIVLWSDRNCMISANLNIWVESWQHVHSIWKWVIDTELFEPSYLAGMQITNLNIFKLSPSTKMLPEVMFSWKKSVDFSTNHKF